MTSLLNDQDQVAFANLQRLYNRTQEYVKKNDTRIDATTLSMSIVAMEKIIQELKLGGGHHSLQSHLSRYDKLVKQLKRLKPRPPAHVVILPKPEEIKQFETEQAKQDQTSLLSLDLDDFSPPNAQAVEDAGVVLRPTGLRQRLVGDAATAGAVQQQQQHEQKHDQDEQEKIQAELVDIAKRLKQTTESINQHLKGEASLLNEVEERTSLGLTKVEAQTSRLVQQLSDGIGLWATLLIVVGALVTFVLMYLMIKIFPKQQT